MSVSRSDDSESGRWLAGRTALVTGSARNIGRGIALAFARAGANVVLNGRAHSAALDETADEVRRLGGMPLIVPADVGDPDAVRAMIERAQAELGAVDIVVSNVGVRHHQPFLDITIDDWHSILNTNLNAAFYLDRAAIPGMMARGWGRIIHISGRDGFHPKADRAHNVTAKAGLFALAKALAIEFGPSGITANTIAPGIVETTRDATHYPDFEQEYEARRASMPVRRLGRVEDIGAACLYLCSEAGGFVTGQVLHVNGGEFIG